MVTLDGIARIETVGMVVRGKYGYLGRIVEVIESSRCSANHISAPLDVVVRMESIGASYGDHTSWASDLTLAHDGDVGAHGHGRDCSCGEPFDEYRNGVFQAFWYHVPASWQEV